MQISELVPIIVLVVMILFIVIRRLSDKKGKEELKSFLNSLATQFEQIIITKITQVDITNINNLTTAENEILDTLYDTLWKTATDELATYTNDPMVKMLLKKYLTRETVETFAKTVFGEQKVQTVFTAKYNNAVALALSRADEYESDAIEKNKELVEDVSPEGIVVPEMNTAQYIDPEKGPVTETIIPPTDEESDVVNPEIDNSVEVIDK